MAKKSLREATWNNAYGIKKMKVILIEPYFEDEYQKIEFQSRENLGLAYLDSSLKASGFHTIVIEAHKMRYSIEKTLAMIPEDAKLIAVSCNSQRNYLATRIFVRQAKKRLQIPIVLGGVFPTIAYKEILNDLNVVDYIVCGEGETPLVRIANYIKNNEIEKIHDLKGIVTHKNKKNSIKLFLHDNINELPFPTRSEIDKSRTNDHFYRILAGRGCHGNCSFCSLITHNTKRRFRAPLNLIEEIQSIIEKYQIRYFTFVDDELFYKDTESKEWIEEFSNGIKEKGIDIEFNIEIRPDAVTNYSLSRLKEVGLKQVYLGVESGIDRILLEMNKGIRAVDNILAIRLLEEYEIGILMGFITIVPTMSFDELMRNYHFLFQLGHYKFRHLFNLLNVYCGSKYLQILEKEKLLKKPENFWERNSYYFKDKKVGLFVEKMKAYRLIYTNEAISKINTIKTIVFV